MACDAITVTTPTGRSRQRNLPEVDVTFPVLLRYATVFHFHFGSITFVTIKKLRY